MCAAALGALADSGSLLLMPRGLASHPPTQNAAPSAKAWGGEGQEWSPGLVSPLPPGALPALLLLLNHLFLFAPASSSGPPSSKVGKTLPPPQTWGWGAHLGHKHTHTRTICGCGHRAESPGDVVPDPATSPAPSPRPNFGARFPPTTAGFRLVVPAALQVQPQSSGDAFVGRPPTLKQPLCEPIHCHASGGRMWRGRQGSEKALASRFHLPGFRTPAGHH